LSDVVELVKAIKKIAVEAVEAAKPVHVCFGLVKSTKPLKIFVDQKMTLGENQLVKLQSFTATTETPVTGSITAYAASFIGKIPYLLGTGRNYNTLEEIVAARGTADCSAFTERVYRHFGAEIGNVSWTQMHAGVGVDRANIQDGDLLILEGGGHVGIYKSGGIVIHEGGANYTGNVKTSPLSAFSLTAIRRIPVGAAAGTTTTTITSGGLSMGDKVALIRQQGGQKYVVMGKIE